LHSSQLFDKPEIKTAGIGKNARSAARWGATNFHGRVITAAAPGGPAMSRFVAIAVSASLLINSAAIAAEQPSTKISSGQRVRITNESGQLIGTVVTVSGDSVRITDGAQER